MNILIIANSSLLGDSLMISGHINALKEYYSKEIILVLCEEKISTVFKLMNVDVVEFNIQNFTESTALPIIETSIDIVINYNYSIGSYHFIKQLINHGKIGKAYGFESHEIGKNLCNEIYDDYIASEDWDNGERNQSPHATLGRILNRIDQRIIPFPPSISLPNNHSEIFKHLQKKTGISDAYLCAFPGAGHPGKRWKLDNFLKVANTLCIEEQCLFDFGPNEKDLYSDFLSLNNNSYYIATTNLSVPELVVLLSRAKLCISNDTGPMHLSCAIGTPTIALFGSTNSKEWFPYNKGKNSVIEKDCASYETCDKCDKRENCIQDITVEEVVNATNELIGNY